ncbi:MAG: PEP-CTERM sorting domain-containing protein [Planctomycetaceae bacterium]|nr:PEP-CTERM sorting domain-containing protein [Planctomycetaceae bacterium]
MKRYALLVFGLSLWAAAAAGPARGQSEIPDFVRNYRFIPRLSTVSETGGFAGVDNKYRVLGSYSFILSPAPWDASAKFAGVNAWGNLISDGPTPAVVLDVDQAFNLSGLKGRQLPVAAPFDVFAFEGTTDDGSSVRLMAAALGNWMYLRGGTTPPPNTADFFTYGIQAVARQQPGADFNLDGLIDRVDLQRWTSRFNSVTADAVDLADANGDFIVDGADFLAWQQQLGDDAPDFSGVDATLSAILASSSTAAVVPEPATGLLALLALAAAASRRRRTA